LRRRRISSWTKRRSATAREWAIHFPKGIDDLGTFYALRKAARAGKRADKAARRQFRLAQVADPSTIGDNEKRCLDLFSSTSVESSTDGDDNNEF
jgi:hypothetical protein